MSYVLGNTPIYTEEDFVSLSPAQSAIQLESIKSLVNIADE